MRTLAPGAGTSGIIPPRNVRPHPRGSICVAAGWWARSVRYLSVALLSGLSAAAVPLVLAVSAPTWVPALLGFTAAAGQLVQGLVRDREQAHLGHQQAVKLQRALRDFQTEADGLSAWELKRRFKEFRDRFEAVKEEYGSEILNIRGQQPPPIGANPTA